MKLFDGKIGTRELVAVIGFTIGIRLSDTTPSLLIRLGKNAAWMLPIFMGACVFIPFLVLLSLLKKHNKGLMEIVFDLMGKKMGFLVGLVLFLIMLSSVVLSMRSYTDIISTMFYQETPMSLLLIMLAAAAYFIANRGFAAIGRTSWIVYPYLMIAVVLLVCLGWREANPMQIFPIEGPGLLKILRGSVTHSSIFGEMILLALFFPFVRTYQQFRLASYIGFTISCIIVAGYAAMYVFIFDYPAVEYLALPFQQLTRAVPIGDMITHAEALFLGFWLIASVLHFSIILYITAFLFARMVHIDEFEPVLLPIAGFAALAGQLPENIMVHMELRQMLIYGASVVLTALPFLLWVLDRLKRRVRT